MPLNYASLEQVSGWRFLWHRLSVAIGRRNVRLVHDPSKNASASLLVGTVIAVVGVGLGFVLAFFRPMGQVGHERIVADRVSGAIYVDVDGVMHPALNLASARLITGQPDNPKQVPMSEIRKSPIGPMVGILGAPNDLTARAPADTGWALCDTLGSTGSQVVPRTTVLAGLPDLGDWAADLNSPRSALMGYGGDVYVVTDGHRSPIDLSDKAVTLALGLPVGDLHPAPMSRALYEALAPAAPLRVPDTPNPGGPVGYSTPALPLVSGSVLRVSDVSGEPQFFVVLPAGVQRVPVTAAMMVVNAAIANGGQVMVASSAQVATLPQAVGFDTSIYPPGAVTLVDKAVEPLTCVMWRKTSGEPRAQVSTVSGRRLPISVGDERRVIHLVQGGEGCADEVYIGRDSANWVQTTGVEPASTRAESLWWITDTGVRFGVPAGGAIGDQMRKALGLSDAPTPAPWAVIRWLPAGPALSKATALAEHDTLAPDQSEVALPTTGAEGNP